MDRVDLIKKIDRYKKQLDTYDLIEPEKSYTFHGGREIGKIEGKIWALEVILDQY